MTRLLTRTCGMPREYTVFQNAPRSVYPRIAITAVDVSRRELEPLYCITLSLWRKRGQVGCEKKCKPELNISRETAHLIRSFKILGSDRVHLLSMFGYAGELRFQIVNIELLLGYRRSEFYDGAPAPGICKNLVGELRESRVPRLNVGPTYGVCMA